MFKKTIVGVVIIVLNLRGNNVNWLQHSPKIGLYTQEYSPYGRFPGENMLLITLAC